jgi:hypothetical protein
MSAAAAPGSYPPGVCPSPTQIDCIEVTKVYDSCFQTEQFSNLCAPIPCDDHCREIAYESGTTVTCTISQTSCTFVSSTPTGVDDFVNATFAVSLTETITLTSTSGKECTLTVPVHFLKTVTLCGPAGTSQVCTVASAICGPCAILDTTVCCQLTVCLVFQSVATVQLLVPSFGFCLPTACTVMGLPPCPPTFPPTCTTTSASTSSTLSSTSVLEPPIAPPAV